MKLTLRGHQDLYAVEQLMMQLFPVACGPCITIEEGLGKVACGW